MTDIDKLFDEYRAQHRSGSPDPTPYLAQAEGNDRVELEALIDGYLVRAPGRPWDAQAFEGSRARMLVDQLVGEWELEDGEKPETLGWKELLPALRGRAQIMRRELVERLAEAIGHPGEAQRVGAYFHQMEIGKLPAEGVSNRVLEALADLLGESAQKLRETGSVVVPGGETEHGAQQQIVFARIAVRNARDERATPGTEDARRAAPPQPAERVEASELDLDEVDHLFTSGPDAG